MILLRVLASKVLFLVAVALAVWAWVWMVSYGKAHGEMACDRHPGVVSVLVPAATVKHASAEGWHRVLVVGDPLGSLWAYDHGRAVEPVRRGVRHLCDGQRFRLRARA